MKSKQLLKELRLGNYVYCEDLDDRAHKVRGVNYKKGDLGGYVVVTTELSSDPNKKAWVFWDKIKPVSLTKEWLIRLGFSEEAMGWVMSTDEEKVRVDLVDEMVFKYLAIVSDSIEGTDIGVLKYVHELQNLLYFTKQIELEEVCLTTTNT